MRKALNHLKQADPVMAAIIGRAGAYKIQYSEPVFQTQVRSIVYQQLIGKAASTIFSRLAEAVKTDPMTPAAILKLRPQRMRSLGLSKQKTVYIRELARLTRDGAVPFERFPEMEDAAIIETLTRVKGIGVWTVHMFLIFALRRPNILPVGDLAVRAAIKKAYSFEQLPTLAEMESIAAAWHPYRSVASWYLWRSLDTK
jgi:DNA-3-methyladenine glycosylase II